MGVRLWVMKLMSQWQNKIEPAFPESIKSYLDLLDSFGLRRSQGYIHIRDTEGFLDVTTRREHQEDK
jgi:hypothetical protein